MTRSSGSYSKIEPKRKYIFICEGRNTEERYFKALINRIKDLDLDLRVDIRLREKTEDDRGLSNPRALVKFAQEEKKNKDLCYAPGHDWMVIFFDADCLCIKLFDSMGQTSEASCIILTGLRFESVCV